MFTCMSNLHPKSRNNCANLIFVLTILLKRLSIMFTISCLDKNQSLLVFKLFH